MNEERAARMLGDKSVSERFVYIKVVHPANLFILFQSDHLPVSYRALILLIFAR